MIDARGIDAHVIDVRYDMPDGDGRLEALEARLRRLEDLEEIRRLFESYGYYLDHGMWAEYASLYAKDGQMRLGPMRADGRDEIERVARDVIGARFDAAAESVSLVHLVGSPRIELDGDRATSEVMWTVVTKGPDGRPIVTGQGRHVDDLVREDGRWCIRKRRGFQDF